MNEAYLALFSKRAIVSGMTPGVEILISTFQLISLLGAFILFY